MLFGSLFKAEKGISIGKGRKRKLTLKDVIIHLDKVELATANCTMIKDSSGNEKIEDYGQVDVFRVNDEAIYQHENGFCITTPTGMKLRSGVGDTAMSDIISVADTGNVAPPPEAAEEDEAESEDALEDEGESLTEGGSEDEEDAAGENDDDDGDFVEEEDPDRNSPSS